MNKTAYFLDQSKYRYKDKTGKIMELQRVTFDSDASDYQLAQKLVTPEYVKQFSNSDEKNLERLRNDIIGGYTCEIALKRILGLPLPQKLGNPDGGVDFKWNGVTYDICSVKYASDAIILPERKQEGKANHYIIIEKRDNRKDKSLNKSDFTYVIVGVISSETIGKLEQVKTYTKEFIQTNYPKFYTSITKANLVGKFEGIDPDKLWQNIQNALFLPIKNNKDVRFFNTDFPLVQDLVSIGLMKVG